MSTNHSLIAPTANPLLERALRDKLARRRAESGSLGELEPLALRLALIQNTLKPRLHEPQLVVVAGDHGLAVEGLMAQGASSTADEVTRLLDARSPVAVLASAQGLALTVVDAGIADRLAAHDRLLIRKIAHGTRNTRLTQAMSVEQAQAALRAGMEIGNSLPGNVIACAGMGVGHDVSAALVLSRLSHLDARELVLGSSRLDASRHSRLAVLAQTALARHRETVDPIEVLAAFGGFELAVLAGMMLSAAQQRRLVMVDGLTACAALMVASRIAGTVTDYCLFCRSQQHAGIDSAMRLFQSSALLELALDCADGCGAALSWPLVRAAGALLVDLADDEPATDAPQGSHSATAVDDGLLHALGGARPREEVLPRGSDDLRAGWHSPFDTGDRENVAASSKVDTRRNPAGEAPN
jgi:nicotinate-nucleotide--dimethylbenzimidazole phosphoribosyltransferase